MSREAINSDLLYGLVQSLGAVPDLLIEIEVTAQVG